MHPNRVLLAALLSAPLIMGGCAKPAASESPEEATRAASGAQHAAGTKSPPLACELVTSAEMSQILGAAVVGVPNEESSGKTECSYAPEQGVSPQVEFAVTWGDGHAAMTAMDMMGNIEPGIANPYQGLGDQAAAVGPALLIRSGEDLVTLTFSGVDDAPAVAKKVFGIAKARM